MVGFVSRPAIEGDLAEPPKLNNSIDPPDHLDPKSNDPSFADSFFDFASIEEWFKDNPPTTTGIEEDSIDTDTGRFDFGGFEMAEEGSEVLVGNPERVGAGVALEEDGSGGKVLTEELVTERELIVDGSGAEVKVGAEECEKLSCSIEKDFEKVSLAGEPGMVGNDGGEDSRSEEASSSSSASSSDEESESTSSSSSEESESDDDQEKVKMEQTVDAEIEEGEILDSDGKQMVGRGSDDEEDDDVENMVTWSDVDEEDEGGGAAKPIKSKNEIADLPPVPPVDVELQPNHQLSPVGVVLSVIGAKVIVEGVEKHNPLSEGSILWITEKRSPLGLIDEIFGPVKNPYYVVRYNSESEVPAGLQDGSMISFVPEFANHVLNDNSLYKKGYDASGDNDEELSDEAEFSDDEKEAEYQRMKKLAKRGLDDQNHDNGKNNKKKGANRDRQRRNNKPTTMDRTQLPPDQSQQHRKPPHDHGNNSSSSTGQGLAGGSGSGPGPIPSFPHNGQAGPGFPQNGQAGQGFPPMPNGPWNNGMMQFQQPQGNVFPGGFPAQAMPWLLQNLFQNPYQMPMPMPFQQQFDPSQRPPCPPGGQPGFFPGPGCPPWGGFAGQNNFNQSGMGLQGQQLPPPMNPGQMTNPSGAPMEQSQQNGNFQAPNAMPENAEAPQQQQQQQFNQGASYGRGGRGRRQFHRGGGRFGGGRGRHQSR